MNKPLLVVNFSSSCTQVNTLYQRASYYESLSAEDHPFKNETSKLSQYELFYFPVRGRGQALRFLFADNGIDYKEINVAEDWETWVKRYKPMMPFGQSPLLKDGDFETAQSMAINRYIGRKHGLYPVDLKEAAKVDMITDHVEDIRSLYSTMIYHNYEKGKGDFVKSLPEKLQYIENLFKKWATEFIATKISFADYNLLDLLDIILILSPTCMNGLPTLQAYYDRMSSRPNLKKYRSSEQFKKIPVNYNGKQ